LAFKNLNSKKLRIMQLNFNSFHSTCINEFETPYLIRKWTSKVNQLYLFHSSTSSLCCDFLLLVPLSHLIFFLLILAFVFLCLITPFIYPTWSMISLKTNLSSFYFFLPFLIFFPVLPWLKEEEEVIGIFQLIILFTKNNIN